MEAARRSTPNILTMIFFQLVQLLNIYFVGHIGSDYLAGVGLGNMLLNVFIFAMSNGLNGTVESFISWALGERDFKLCGIRLNQARIIVMTVLVPFILMFFFVDKILIAIKQDPWVSLIARNYVVWTLPGVLSLVQFDALKRFLQVVDYSHVSTTIQVSTTIGHYFWGYLFIIHLDWKVAGAALALNTTYITNFLIQEFYVHTCGSRNTINVKRKDDSISEQDTVTIKDVMQPLFTAQSFNKAQWCEFFKLGIPGTLMQCAEWWAFELLAIFAGILGTH